MANVVTVQTLHDGPAKAVVKVLFTIDTSNLAETVVVDPATLMIDQGYSVVPNRVTIEALQFAVDTRVALLLQWKATTNVDAYLCYDAAEVDFSGFGGLRNNAGAGITGQLVAITTGWTAGAVSGSAVIEVNKCN